MKRTYKITSSGSVTREVFPINNNSLLYNWKKQDDSINYVLELTTKLVFTNNSKTGIYDFDFFRALESNTLTRCEDIICNIYKTCDGVESLEYTGLMRLVSGDWNLDRCTVSLKLERLKDIYDCIGNNKKKTSITLCGLMPFLNAAPDVTCGYTVNSYNVGISNVLFTGSHLYDTTDPDPDNWTEIYVDGLTVCVTDDTSTWTAIGGGFWSQTHTYFTYITGGLFNIYDSPDPITGEYNFPMTRKLIAGTTTFQERIDPISGIYYEPYQSFAILCYSVVSELLVACGRDFHLEMLRSDFFDWNAKGDTAGYVPSTIPKLPTNLATSHYPNPTVHNQYKYIYLPRVPGINYVTGQSNHLTHLHYIPKSNAKNPYAGQWEAPVTPTLELNTNKLTFEDIEKIWATVFQAYWFIDSDGCMRVEHVSWFNNNSTMYDSTISPNSEFNQANRKYTYKKDLFVSREVFKFSQNKDFVNGRVDSVNANFNNEIIYEGACINTNQENKSEYTLAKIVTDTKIFTDSEDYDNAGLFLCTVTFGTPIFKQLYLAGGPFYLSLMDATIDSEQIVGSASPTYYLNAHVQWANLIRRYLKDNRVLRVGKNGVDNITFTARLRRTKEQKNVILKYCCGMDAFNPKQALIKTELGLGDINEAEYDTKTGIIKITALHD